jgi:hypothetical protein
MTDEANGHCGDDQMGESLKSGQDLERVPLQYLQRTLFLELELDRLSRAIKARRKKPSGDPKRGTGRSKKRTRGTRR